VKKKTPAIKKAEPKPEKPKSSWNPFKFISAPKPKEASKPATTVNDNNKKKKDWKPFSFAKPAPQEPVSAKIEETIVPIATEENEPVNTENSAVEETTPAIQ